MNAYKLTLDDFDDNETLSGNSMSDFIHTDTYMRDRVEFEKLEKILEKGILDCKEYEKLIELSKKLHINISCKNQKNLMDTIKFYNVYKKQQKYNNALAIK